MTSKTTTPLIEAWYKTETGDIFEVVAIDDDGIGIQYLDGMLEELDREDWDSLAPREINPPRAVLAQNEEYSHDDNQAYDCDENESDLDEGWQYSYDD